MSSTLPRNQSGQFVKRVPVKTKRVRNRNKAEPRPLFPNHNEKVATVKKRQCEFGLANYSKNVLELADQFGMKYPIQTCRSRDNKYTRKNIYGLELEVSTDVCLEDFYNHTEYPFFVLKSDSTIPSVRRYSFEIVTVTSEANALCLNMAMLMDRIKDKTENNLSSIGGERNANKSNGMHIHVDKENFIDKRHLNNFLHFFNQPSSGHFIFYMSDRDNYQTFQKWSAPLSLNGTYGQSYKKIAGNTQTSCRSADKYTATNMNNAKTVEVRIFQGDTSAASVCKNIQFVDSVVEFTKERSLVTSNMEAYLHWLASTPRNQYLELKEFVNKQIPMEEALRFNDMMKLAMNRSFKTDEEFEKSFRFYDITVDYMLSYMANANGGPFRVVVKNEEDGGCTVNLKWDRPKRTRLFEYHATTIKRYERAQLGEVA